MIQDIINGLKSIKNCIENDTFEFLENDKPMQNLTIEYKGMKVSLPLDIAEVNNITDDALTDIIDYFSEY